MKKSNVFNDGVKNAEESQDLDGRLNMPAGKKKPLKTGG